MMSNSNHVRGRTLALSPHQALQTCRHWRQEAWGKALIEKANDLILLTSRLRHYPHLQWWNALVRVEKLLCSSQTLKSWSETNQIHWKQSRIDISSHGFLVSTQSICKNPSVQLLSHVFLLPWLCSLHIYQDTCWTCLHCASAMPPHVNSTAQSSSNLEPICSMRQTDSGVFNLLDDAMR